MTITVERLRAVRTALEMDGATLRLSSSLWRDFMHADGDGQALTGVIKVEAADGGPLPEGLSIASVWLTTGDEIWKPDDLEPRGSAGGTSELEVIARGGPEWRPNTLVDVVARIEDGDGVRRNLRAPDQRVRRAG
jgi:hypothetical protein